MHENDRFCAAVCEMLRQYAPDSKGSRVTVAVSGGADSVALCHFLASHAQQLEIEVAAAHLNHGLRGQESDRDEAFVRAFCAQRNIPLVCEQLVPDGVHPSEAHLRQRRYEFLWRAAGDGFLATAHTLTDSCETLLLHLARGSRLGGLRGIAARQGKLLRPLLTLNRADVEAYCAKNGLSYVQDSSNATDLYARNRLRHGAMPALRSVNPQAEQAMGALMQEAGELYAYLSAQAQTLLDSAALPVQPDNDSPRWDAAVLAAAPDVVLRYALTLLLGKYGDCSAARIALAVECIRSGGAVEWCVGVRLRCENGYVRIECKAPEILPSPGFCAAAQEGRFICAPDITVQIRRLEKTDSGAWMPAAGESGEKAEKVLKIHKKDLNNCLDYDKITSILSAQGAAVQTDADKAVLQLRFRQPGDRFSPGRGRGDKSLKKWLNECGCPPVLRSRLPLLAVGERVVWLAGSGAAEGFAATETTHTVWEILWQAEVGEELPL